MWNLLSQLFYPKPTREEVFGSCSCDTLFCLLHNKADGKGAFDAAFSKKKQELEEKLEIITPPSGE